MIRFLTRRTFEIEKSKTHLLPAPERQAGPAGSPRNPLILHDLRSTRVSGRESSPIRRRISQLSFQETQGA